MNETSDKFMAYIDAEVRSACEQKGWGSQVRRKWSARLKPVSESEIEDYEWKLIPVKHGKSRDLQHGVIDEDVYIDEGTYYVLSYDPRGAKFVLQHDTLRGGIFGPHWNLRSYTEIHLRPWRGHVDLEEIVQLKGAIPERLLEEPLPAGWLRDYLVELTTRFRPNHFSVS